MEIMTFDIAGRKVGPDHPPLVLVEVGINHEGEIGKALKLVDAAVAAGAEVVKFQCHITEKEMVPTDMTPGEISTEKLWDIIKRCELTAAEEGEVQSYCAEKGVIYLSTPFSREAADRLNEMGVPAFKIASFELVDIPLVQAVARTGLPLIMSTGMATLEEITEAVEAFSSSFRPSFSFLPPSSHCLSRYS
jgi:N-acetylneuraminate synthase